MNKVTPIDEQYIYDGSACISQTDLDGNIIYANKKFCEVSGYTTDELFHSSHNIIRHPDMPKAVFAKMWEAISGGQSWNGLLKNLRKDGKYYWISLEIIPTKDDLTNKITGYIATGKKAPEKDIKESTTLYKKMLEAQE